MPSNNPILSTMIEKAIQVMKNAYVPYSHFPVGACLRTTENQLFCGCNFENASFSISLCAERAAIASMISHGQQKIADIVIVSEKKEICPPCGACRQVIAEFATPDTKIYLINKKGDIKQTLTIDELLPYTFKFDE